MSKYWINPSRSAEVFDPVNNKHIQPGGKVYKCPHNNLITRGKLLEVNDTDRPQTINGAIYVTSSLTMAPVEGDDGLVLADPQDGLALVAPDTTRADPWMSDNTSRTVANRRRKRS